MFYYLIVDRAISSNRY